MIITLKKYGFIGSFRLFFDVIISRLFISRKVRIVRRPFYIRGNKHIMWGNNFTSGINLRIDAFPFDNKLKHVLEFGDNIQVNDYVHIGAVNKVVIGNNVLIASKVYISDHNHGLYNGANQSSPEQEPEKRPIQSLYVIIEDNVWIGEQVSILPGVRIGMGSIIGANSVVTKNIPSNCIVVGNPAKIIKKYNNKTKKWEKV